MVDRDKFGKGSASWLSVGVDLQRSITSRPANVYRLAKWAADCACRSNFSPAWLATGDEPDAPVSRAEIMAILDRIALEETCAAIERERLADSSRPTRTFGYRNHTPSCFVRHAFWDRCPGGVG
jgi:hypothetical protein